MGTVRGLVAPHGPTGSSRNIHRVITATDADSPVNSLLLIVTLQAQRVVACAQHPGVYGAVVGMTCRAAFADSFMFEHERTALGRVASQTGIIGMPQPCRSTNCGISAALRRFRLLPMGARTAAHDGITAMRIMAICAGDLPFQHRVGVGQPELPILVQMALEAGVRRATRIDDRPRHPSRKHMFAAGTMTGLTPDIF